MTIHEIADGNVLLARHITADEWDNGVKFFSANEDFIQVGTWGYDQGMELLAHKHNHVDRLVNVTQEVLYVRKGTIEAKIYNQNQALIDRRVVREGDIIVLLFGGHGYSILENGTQVLEVKNGPYVGPERDRVRF